jgi:hypothetical protein
VVKRFVVVGGIETYFSVQLKHNLNLNSIVLFANSAKGITVRQGGVEFKV